MYGNQKLLVGAVGLGGEPAQILNPYNLLVKTEQSHQQASPLFCLQSAEHIVFHEMQELAVAFILLTEPDSCQ